MTDGPPRGRSRPKNTREPSRAGDPRRTLWRDAATLLVVVVIALLAAQTFLPRDTGGPADSAIPSGIVIRSLPPGFTLQPPATFPPIIDPSLGIDATPTPIPVITFGPSPKPTPKPTPKRTIKPSASPTAAPTSAP
jgi:hypothetical protein